MSLSGVDYDRIAQSYDRRFVENGLSGIAAALSSLVDTLDPRCILEVGCGTGHWLAGLRSATTPLFGLDLSAGMLRQARERDVTFCLVQGRASQLPFPDSTFDLVCCVNALHHFQRQSAFVAEARRLLRPSGALAIAGMDPRGHRARWYLYDYFEGTYETDLVRFPSWGTVLDWMVARGFERIEWDVVEQIHHVKMGRAILVDPFLQKDATSQLALLTDEAYAAGLRRIETALAAAGVRGETIAFRTDLCLAMVVGRLCG